MKDNKNIDTEENIPEFGTKRENEERRDGGFGIIFDPEIQKYVVLKHEDEDFLRFPGGGVDENEDLETGTLREIIEESGLHDFLYVEKVGVCMTHYFNNLKNVNRIAKAACFLVVLKSKSLVSTKLEEHEKFSLTWATPKEILENWENTRKKEDQPEHWIYFLKKTLSRAKELGYDTTNLEYLE